MREMSGKPPEVTTTTQVSLGVDVHVPEDYIAETNQRLMVYKKIASATTVAEIDELRVEVGDRFGEPPEPVLNLLEQARLKVEAQALNIEGIERRGLKVLLRFGPDVRFDPEKVVAFVKKGPDRRFHQDGRLELPIAAGAEAFAPLRAALAALALK